MRQCKWRALRIMQIASLLELPQAGRCTSACRHLSSTTSTVRLFHCLLFVAVYWGADKLPEFHNIHCEVLMIVLRS